MAARDIADFHFFDIHRAQRNQVMILAEDGLVVQQDQRLPQPVPPLNLRVRRSRAQNLLERVHQALEHRRRGRWHEFDDVDEDARMECCSQEPDITLYQSIIFMVHKTQPVTPNDFESYVLLPKKFKKDYARICDEFGMHDKVTVISDNKTYPGLIRAARKGNVEIVEALVSVKSSAESYFFYPNFKLTVYAQNCNEEVIRSFFSETDFDIQFHGFEEVHSKSTVISAFDEGNLNFLEDLVSVSPAIRYRHPLEGTFLHFAVECQERALVTLLLKSGCYVNGTRKDGSTALHLAAYTGNKVIAFLLLKKSGRHSLSTKMMKSTPTEVLFRSTQVCTGVENATPLHIAVEKDYSEMVELLLDKGADIDEEASPGLTPLRLAVDCESTEAIKIILTKSPHVQNIHNIRAFYWAMMDNDLLFNMLEYYGFRVELTDIYEKALLHGAVRQNKVDIVDGLLRNGARINETFYEKIYQGTPLHTAAKYSGEDMINLLLTRGADIDAKRDDGLPPLYDAVQKLNITAIKLLLGRGASLDGWAFPPLCLHEACNTGDADIVRLLLQCGVDGNSINSESETPLFVAARKGSVRMVQDLIQYAVNLNGKSANGTTPLHEACAGGSPAVVETLLKNGADVNARRADGRTPLFEAVDKGHAAVVAILAKFDARVDNAILFLAYERRNSQVFQALLDNNFGNPYIVKRVGMATRRGLSSRVSFEGESDFHHDLERHARQLKGADLLTDLGELSCSYHELEISTMKTKYIGESSVTFYDILMRPLNRVAGYARNPEIGLILASLECEQQFPIYVNILRSQFGKGLLRKEMLEQAIRTCGGLFDRNGILPDHNKEMILRYLSMLDLGTLLNVCTHLRRAR